MKISVTDLRSNIYKYFDQIKASESPLEVVGKKGVYVISYVGSSDIYTKLQSDGLDLIVGDPDDLLSIEWAMTSSEEEHLS